MAYHDFPSLFAAAVRRPIRLKHIRYGLAALRDLSTRTSRRLRCFRPQPSKGGLIEEETFHQDYWRRTSVPLPPEISVELSSRCDLRCATCSLSYRKDAGQDMEPRVFDLLLEQTRDFCGSYNLHGIGESLLHRELIPCIRKVKDCKALCRITTNGLKLTPDLARDMIEAGMDSVTFSVDAATPETYRRVRRSNAFERLQSNIRALADIRAELGRDRPKITTAFVTNTKNAQDLPEFVDWSGAAGADLAFIQCYEDRGWGDHGISKEKELDHLLAAAERRAGQRNIPLEYEYPARIEVEAGRVETEGLQVWDPDLTNVTDPPRYTACEATWRHGIVRADGNVDTCWFGETLGNILEEPFVEIWNGPRIRKFRQRQRCFTAEPPPCCAKARGWNYCNPLSVITDSVAMGEKAFPQLGLGWHIAQNEGELDFRFTDSVATVFLKNTGKPYLAMRLRIDPALGGHASREQVRGVDVSVNGLRVGRISVGLSWEEHIVRIPFLKNEYLEVTLHADDFTIPCRSTETFDFRRLGVAASLIALRSTRWPGWTM